MGKIKMATKFILATLLISISTMPAALENKVEILEKLSKERYFPYQDILINGELLSKGVGPDCISRYSAIAKAIGKYKQPIKVLDLGASNGYFSLRIAQDFKALCVMADVSERLLEICKLNDQVSNLIYLKRELSLEDLKLLKEQEHFDVVLALNVVHHMEPWKEILDTIFELGDTIIVETPPSNDDRVKSTPSIPLIEEYLLNKPKSEIIAQTARAAANNFDQIAILDDKADHLAQKRYTMGAYAKMFHFENAKSVAKEISFQLSTYNVLNGVFPLRHNLQDTSHIYLN